MLKKNNDVCCVCKTRGLGVNLHHLDGDRSNTVEANLAVLCVRDHDSHHRPKRYDPVRHLSLGPEEIKKCKQLWEAFVAEASKSDTKILAVINIYGEKEFISALRIAFQWEKHVGFQEVINASDLPQNLWMEKVYDIINWLGKDISTIVIDKILPFNFCPTCVDNGKSKPTRLDPKLYESITKKLTSATWDTDSSVSIYSDPDEPFLTFVVLLGTEVVNCIRIHKEGKNIVIFCSDPLSEEEIHVEKFSRKDLEEVIRDIIVDLILKWEPARCAFITREGDSLALINGIALNEAWYRNDYENDEQIGLIQLIKNIA